MQIEISKNRVRSWEVKQSASDFKNGNRKSLIGESAFTAEQLSEAIRATQNKVNERTFEKEKLQEELNDKQGAMGKLGYYYNQFLSWADEFQNSTLEQRKMIACQLIRGVKVSRGYNVNIEFNMNYQQFCEGL